MVELEQPPGRGVGAQAPANTGLTRRMHVLAARTRRRLAVLGSAIAPHARRRPDHPVPPLVLANARLLLADAQKILSSGDGRTNFHLGAAPLWSELDAALQLVAAELAEAEKRNAAESPIQARLRALIQARVEELAEAAQQRSGSSPA